MLPFAFPVEKNPRNVSVSDRIVKDENKQSANENVENVEPSFLNNCRKVAFTVLLSEKIALGEYNNKLN